MVKLSEDEARQRLQALNGWTRDGDAIRKAFTFKSFPEAMSFAVRVGFEAEAADHHPDFHVSYRTVTLVYSTHSAGGLTDKDFAGATRADQISWV